MDQPLISVIIPCHNATPYIKDSLAAMLGQTYKNLEIILIDDNSQDDLLSVVQPYLDKYPHIKYYRLPENDPERTAADGTDINAGWMSRSYGIKMAKGDLITFQDDDDGSCCNRIEFQYEMMKKYGVAHINLSWQGYKDEYNCKRLDFEPTDKDILTTEQILKLAKKTRSKIFKHPFAQSESKRPVQRFFRSLIRKHLIDWTPYPGAANSPLIDKKVFEKCSWRRLYERTRPSIKGRGCDRDFNFSVAETFKSSLVIKAPLYLWRTKWENWDFRDEKYRPK
jgi:hypothetical protein